MSQGASPRNIDQERQGPTKTVRKGGAEGKIGETQDHSKGDLTLESEPDMSGTAERRDNAQSPTKGEIMEMFQRLENLIKSEISMLRGDLGNLLE